MDALRWLEKNGMDCKAYGARVSRAMCATYQKTGDMAACGSCPDAVRGVPPLPMKKKPFGRGLHLYIDQGLRLELPESDAKPETCPKEQVAVIPERPAHVRSRRRPKRQGGGKNRAGGGLIPASWRPESPGSPSSETAARPRCLR